MEDVLVPIAVVGMLFIGLPWLVLHYLTNWKRARGLSIEDEQLLDNLHDTARRLDDRLQSIERIMTAENPRWREAAIEHRPTAEIKELHNARSSH
jgi:phage shock protein B